MKGVIFGLLESFVHARWGEDTFEEILASTPLETQEPFVGPGTYPEVDLRRLFDTLVARAGADPRQIWLDFGRFCVPVLAAKHPVFFPQGMDAISFLHSLDRIHHVELKKLVADAQPPRLRCRDLAPGRLLIEYDSRSRFCDFAEGLLHGIASHFGSEAEIQHLRCVRHGDPVCEFTFQIAAVPEPTP
jgi:hypothetical protein